MYTYMYNAHKYIDYIYALISDLEKLLFIVNLSFSKEMGGSQLVWLHSSDKIISTTDSETGKMD